MRNSWCGNSYVNLYLNTAWLHGLIICGISKSEIEQMGQVASQINCIRVEYQYVKAVAVVATSNSRSNDSCFYYCRRRGIWRHPSIANLPTWLSSGYSPGTHFLAFARWPTRNGARNMKSPEHICSKKHIMLVSAITFTYWDPLRVLHQKVTMSQYIAGVLVKQRMVTGHTCSLK